MLLRFLTSTQGLVTKDAATQRGAVRKSYICACNPARLTQTTGSGHLSTRLAYLTLYFHAISAS